jgi:small subunit ribosomal protein S16
MLTIRLQRTGRSGHAQFRVIVQDSRFSPTRGRVVAYLGSYDPHTKTATVDGVKAGQYLANGAQPSDRVARLLQKEGIKLPDWVKLEQPQSGTTRNPAKRRSTRPAEPKSPEAEAPAEAEPAEEPTAETPAAEEAVAEPAEETPVVEPAVESTPAETEEPIVEPEAPAPDTSREEPAA